MSIVLRPRDERSLPLLPETFSWLSLIAAATLSCTLKELARESRAKKSITGEGQAILPESVTVKWPNDVLISGKKVSGILAQLSSDSRSIVLGIGININIDLGDLPLETSTSVSIFLGRTVNFDELLSRFLTNFSGQYLRFCSHSGDAVSSGLRDIILSECSTVGLQVRVELPGGDMIRGRATGIDPSGQLELRVPGSAQRHYVSAGDVVHVRPE